MKRIETVVMLALAAAGLSACTTGPATPDEFRVIRKAPLTVPPDFNLRPPAPGQSRPQDLDPDAAARAAVFGVDIGRNASDGEKLLVRSAGGEAVQANIRQQLDFDSAEILRKPRSFTDQILSFGKPGAANEPVVDAAAEAQRIKESKQADDDLTGGKDILIRKKAASKLPGL